MSESATVRTIEHAEPSELPETNWLWRRIFIFGGTLACLGLAYWAMWKATDIGTVRTLGVDALYLVAFFALIYIAGAGSDDITRLVTAFRSTRKETVTTAPPPGQVTATATGASVATTTPSPVADLKPPWERT